MYALFRVGHRRIKAALDVETVTRRSTTATFANTGGCSCAGSTEYHEIHVAKLDEGARQSSGGMLGYAPPCSGTQTGQRAWRRLRVLGSGRSVRRERSGCARLTWRRRTLVSQRVGLDWVDPEGAREAMTAAKLTLPVYDDRKRSLSVAVGQWMTPQAFLFAPDGHTVYEFTGPLSRLERAAAMLDMERRSCVWTTTWNAR